MLNNQLLYDLIEKRGEENQIKKIIETSLQFSLSLQKFSSINKKDNYSKWSESYNDVCSKIAEMKFVLEQCEFMFNSSTINEHFDLLRKQMENELSFD